jgi:histidinol dehydrogenase
LTRAGLRGIGGTVMALARAEGLDGHAESIAARVAP